MPPEVIVDTAPQLAERLAERFAAEAADAITARGSFSFALTGGSLGPAFFPRLARVPLDWSRTDVFWGDERAVPPTSPDSNYRLARELWLEPAAVPAARVHRMEGEAGDLAAAAAAYAIELEQILGSPPRLDIALLGEGPDGHVCSLFPGHPLLREDRRWAAALEDAPKPPPGRLTLTLPTLAAARLVVVVALGAAKAPAVREALERAGSELPLSLVTARAGRVLFLLDRAAAGTAPPTQVGYRELAGDDEPDPDELTSELDEALATMQTDEAATGFDALFEMESEVLGRAAVQGARDDGR
jgi:6-phosphogluconolactonase